jgi:hypothetical protein
VNSNWTAGSVASNKTEKIRSYTQVYITWIFQSYGRTPWHSLVQSSRNHNSAVLVWNANSFGCEIAKSNVWTVKTTRERSYCRSYMPKCIWSDLYVRSSNSLSHSPLLDTFSDLLGCAHTKETVSKESVSSNIKLHLHASSAQIPDQKNEKGCNGLQAIIVLKL